MNIDQTSTKTGGSYTSPFTWAHTVNYANEVLFLITQCANSAAYRTLTPATFNGDAMTQLASRTANYGGSEYNRTNIFYLHNPPVGTFNFSLTPSAGVYVACAACGIYDSGIGYTGYQSTYNNSSLVTSTSTLTTTKTASDSWVLSFIGLIGSTGNPSASGHTQIVTASDATYAKRVEIGYVPTATQLTTQYTWTGSSYYFMASLELKRTTTGGNIMWF